MTEKPISREMARRFLLGAVDDSEREQIEALFMTDPETEMTILTVEDELLEAYLEDTLPESDKAQFLQLYGHKPRQQRRLRITASIREYALSEAQRTHAGTSSIEQVRGFPSFAWLRQPRFIPIAASLIVLVIVAIWLIQWNNQRLREANLRSALQKELTDLNSGSGSDQSSTSSVVLPPVSLRSINSPPRLMSRSSYEVIELQLLLPRTEDAEQYTALLSRVEEDEAQFTVVNLHQEKTAAGTVVKLRLPARLLPPGPYELSLTGIPNGSTHQYDLEIVD